MGPEENLRRLGITLPVPPKPVANYISAVRVGNVLMTSGILPIKDGVVLIQGKLGDQVSIQEGQEASRISLLNALAVVKDEMGSLDRVERIVKLTGYVASGQGFIQQAMVLNGASDLLVSIFGKKGLHARVAVGAYELPLGSSVEIELIVELIVN